MPYTDATKLATYLGRALTAAETAQAAAVLAAVDVTIDRETGRSWAGAAVSSEWHTVEGTVVYLRSTPVNSITSVKIRSSVPGDTPTTLTANVQYELIDARRGVLLINVANGFLVDVAYTVTQVLPADLALAATMLAARLLSPTSSGSKKGIKSYSTGGGELSVTYEAEGADTESIEIMRTLRRYRRAVGFA